MKHDKQDWISLIQHVWKYSKIKYILADEYGAIKAGPFGSQLLSSEMECGSYKVYNQRTVISNDFTIGEHYITEEKYKQLEVFRVKAGDLLLSSRGTIGRCSIVPESFQPGIIHPCLIKMHLDKRKALNNFVIYLFQDKEIVLRQLKILSNATTIEVIYSESLKNLVIPLPNIKTQKIITSFLDQETSRIDTLIAKKQRQIELLQEKRQAIITRAVTKGLDPVAKMKDSGVDWIGEIPEGWEVRRLRYLGVCQNGITTSGDNFGTGFPFVSYGDVYRNDILPEYVSGLVESTKSDRSVYSVEKGDVFFTRTSESMEEIGFSATCFETIQDAVFAGFLIRFRPNQSLLRKEFTRYLFRAQILRNFFVKEMNIVTRASLSQDLLKKVPVILPPVEMQMKIGQYLDEMTTRVDHTIKKIKKSIDLLKEYRSSLITHAVTGQIDIEKMEKVK